MRSLRVKNLRFRLRRLEMRLRTCLKRQNAAVEISLRPTARGRRKTRRSFRAGWRNETKAAGKSKRRDVFVAGKNYREWTTTYGLMWSDGWERRRSLSLMRWFPIRNWKETLLRTNSSISVGAFCWLQTRSSTALIRLHSWTWSGLG